MRTVEVRPASGPYRVILGRGLVTGGESTPALASVLEGRKVYVVSDGNVYALHGGPLERWLATNGARPLGRTVIEPGESSKNLSTMGGLWDGLIRSGLERTGLVVAFGGGVVGDLAGFAAATYLRGVDFIQVPTTVLAMVDSSVGGKTGCDHPLGKNLIGAFHQPKAVLADLDFLETLPAREILSGLAEAIKAAIIGDPELFRIFELRGPEISGDKDALLDAIARSVTVKAAVVGADEKEGGSRALLNLGHTLGHALEAVSGYAGLSHGEAVGTGMIFASRLSRELGMIEPADAERITGLLKTWGYSGSLKGMDAGEIKKAFSYDKKKASGLPRWVLPRGIGKVQWGIPVEEATLDLLLDTMQR